MALSIVANVAKLLLLNKSRVTPYLTSHAEYGGVPT